MSLCIISPTARDDLQQIHEYIAQYNSARATRSVEDIRERCYLLADYPYMGIARSDLGEGCRSFVVPNTGYVIMYRPIEDGVEITRVRHGSQSFRRLFQQ